MVIPAYILNDCFISRLL